MKIGSLHAGIGGFSIAFENLKVNTLWANEIDKNACKTYRENFSHKLYEGAIEDLNIEKLEKVDILTSGFPCQAFSIAGERKGFKDERGNQFFEVMKIVDVIKPKVIFFENVKNLHTHDGGRTFKIMFKNIRDAGYDIKYSILNTKDYGNLPQNRERIYVVCFRKDINSDNFKFPAPIKRTKKIAGVLETEVEEKYYYREDKYNYKELKEAVTKYDTCYQWRRIYVRENKNNVCPTLTANMGTGGHNVPIILTKKGIRKLTPRECFRIQGYPESYIFPEKMANSHLYKQVGNTVSVPIVERIAKNIIEVLLSSS